MDAYRRSARSVIEELSHEGGLTQAEVDERRIRDGSNTLPKSGSASFGSLLLYQLRGYLVWLLILVGCFALIVGLITGAQEQLFDAAIIFLIVVFNAVLGAYQDYKAERFSQTLTETLETTTTVVRAGQNERIEADGLVVGDIFILAEGDQVPADARIITAENLTVDESSLTGESVASRKHARTIRENVPLAERKNMVYKGTFVRTGTATCVTIATGPRSEIGRIAAPLPAPRTSRFLGEVDHAAGQIVRIALPLIAVALVLFYVQQGSWVDLIMLGSALVIGSIPEGLPAIVTFTLSLSSLQLSKKGTLVKRKSTLETLGSIDVLCTDKTGTLTENRMTVTDLHTFAGDSIDSLPKRLRSELERCSLLANEAKNTAKGFVGNAEDLAIIDLYNHHDTDILAIRDANAIASIESFTSENRRMHVELEDGAIYEKGAPDVVLEDVTHRLGARKSALSAKKRAEIERFIERRSREGKRVMMLVRRDPEPTYLATLALEDPPKRNTPEAVEQLYAAGIHVKMITGDSLETALAIARQCGFSNPKGIGWDELKDLSEPELIEAVERCNVFARTSPTDKHKIVSALQSSGRVVGITGDGVNDVPALKQADIGISMTRASDIAKDAADLIILDGNLMHVLDGVKSGRTIFDNMRKVINYLLTANISEVVVVFIAAIFGLLPFTAIQLLWVNFITDLAPAMALGADPAHPNVMKRAPTGASERLIDREIILHTVFIGLKKVGFLLGIFLIAFTVSGDLMLAQTVTFTWLVLSHLARIVSIRVDEHVSLFTNRWLLGAMAMPLVLQVAIIYTPLAAFFKVVPLEPHWWGLLFVAVVLSIAGAAGIAKIIDRSTGGFMPDADRSAA